MLKKGEKTNARSNYNYSVTTLTNIGQIQHPQMAMTQLGLARLIAQDRKEDAEKLLNSALEIAKAKVPGSSLLANIYEEQGLFYLNSESPDYAKAIASLNEALKIRSNLFEADSPPILRLLDKLAIVHENAKQYDKAKEYRELILARLKVNSSSNELAFAYISLARLYKTWALNLDGDKNADAKKGYCASALANYGLAAKKCDKTIVGIRYRVRALGENSEVFAMLCNFDAAKQAATNAINELENNALIYTSDEIRKDQVYLLTILVDYNKKTGNVEEAAELEDRIKSLKE